MKTRAPGTTVSPSNDRCGVNARTPSASRRKGTRTLLRGTFARSVKFSFLSIAHVDHAYDEIAPQVESFHRQLELRRRRDQLERVQGSGPHRGRLEDDGDLLVGQIEVEGTVLAKWISRADAIGHLAAKSSADEARVG